MGAKPLCPDRGTWNDKGRLVASLTKLITEAVPEKWFFASVNRKQEQLETSGIDTIVSNSGVAIGRTIFKLFCLVYKDPAGIEMLPLNGNCIDPSLICP